MKQSGHTSKTASQNNRMADVLSVATQVSDCLPVLNTNQADLRPDQRSYRFSNKKQPQTLALTKNTNNAWQSNDFLTKKNKHVDGKPKACEIKPFRCDYSEIIAKVMVLYG